ncbi:hypothetical protein CALCODRAFT_27043 [Calocera cornea HHB12733]|uniref:Uncharacterized protein n=1 Tax=Calocera cornea HHB12733 TaxID=1353952 RepID=A0A165J404_9BASI|nr:hypothetical protein CALCODRAFT_27043 [Calocera cornea HHB12733]
MKPGGRRAVLRAAHHAPLQGLELTGFDPQGLWEYKGAESETNFREIELGDSERASGRTMTRSKAIRTHHGDREQVGARAIARRAVHQGCKDPRCPLIAMNGEAGGLRYNVVKRARGPWWTRQTLPRRDMRAPRTENAIIEHGGGAMRDCG